jgi:S1-C subfamily serine protease
MGLPETFDAVRPSIVAFISRVARRPAGAEPPLFPSIIGTGFFVHGSGIVVTNRHVIGVLEQVNQLPRNPRTGTSAAGALIFTEIQSSGGQQVIGVLNRDVLGWNALQQFEAGSRWFGESVPDLGFVQLDVCNVPALRMATEPNTLRVGVSIATAGFPEGSAAITFHGKITQVTPILRHGIISSVFPFAGPYPHGFSVDALLQGGASGSPVFKTDEAIVVGMIASQIKNTNYTVCVPSDLLAAALTSALPSWPSSEGIPTLGELIRSEDRSAEETLGWEAFPIAPTVP